MEGLVRAAMTYDEDVHTSKAHYEREVVKETKRRMSATDVNSNLILCIVLQNLKHSGVTQAGQVPTAASDVFGKTAPFVSNEAGPSASVNKPQYNWQLPTPPSLCAITNKSTDVSPPNLSSFLVAPSDRRTYISRLISSKRQLKLDTIGCFKHGTLHG